MKFGKYKISFSECGKHYIELLGGWLCIAVIIISLSAVISWLFLTADNDTLQVKHVYEDGCLDVYDTKKDTYKFYCEDMTFYGE